MIFGDRAFGGLLDLDETWGWGLHDRISALIWRYQSELSYFLSSLLLLFALSPSVSSPVMWAYREKVAIYKPGGENGHAGTLILDF